MEKSKAEKSPWAKINKKRGPKKKVRAAFLQEKKNILAESNKGSLFDQEPLTSSASAEDPQRSKIIGASSLKIKVSADRKQDCFCRNLMEPIQKHKQSPRIVISKS